MDTYFLFVYGGVAIFLMLRIMYLVERLRRYIDRKYPKEAKVIRFYEWQGVPWSVGQRTMRALIKKQSSSDPELALRSKKVKRNLIYFIMWPLAVFSIDLFIAIYNFLARAK